MRDAKRERISALTNDKYDWGSLNYGDDARSVGGGDLDKPATDHHLASVSVSAAVDPLATGLTTMRDRDGVVWSQRLSGLTETDKDVLVASGNYTADELFEFGGDRPWPDLEDVRRNTAGQWRSMVRSGIPVDDVLRVLVERLIHQLLRPLGPHLKHAIAKRPELITRAVRRATGPNRE
jgi:hypothetical protein